MSRCETFGLTAFWRHYRLLPEAIQNLADKNFELLKADPHHRSLHLKKVGQLWSVRVGAHYRALGRDGPDAIPKGTVTFMRVAPREPLHLSDLRLDLTKFAKEQGDYDVIGHFYYIDEAEGFSISVNEREGGTDAIIGAFVYGPASRDNQMRCKRGRFRLAPPTISFRSA